MSAPHKTVTEYSEGRRSTADQLTIDVRLTRLERLAEAVANGAASDARAATETRRGLNPEHAQTHEPPQASAALTRQNLRLRISVGVLGSAALSLSVLATSLFSFRKGVNDDEPRVVEIGTEKVEDRLTEQERRITEVVTSQGDTAKSTDKEIRSLAELQILQWGYMAEVLEAQRQRKPIPKKPQLLIDAEARALTAIRDREAKP